MTTFENIKNIAQKRGLSLKEVAINSGLSENALYRYNQGIEPKFETLKAVAETLGVRVEDLSSQYKKNDSTPKKADLDDDDVIFTYQGKPLSDEDKEIIKRIMRGK